MTKIYSFINRILITSLLTLIILISYKKSNNFKEYFKNNVFGVNFNFGEVNKLYNKYFGTDIPFKDILEKEKTVFNEKLEYSSKEKYYDGVKLKVSSDFFVPSLDDGIVVYVGEKENYGNVVIVNLSSGIDVWYGNLSNTGVNLYDFVSKGSLIGNTKDYLYLVFKKDGNILNYEDYI